MAPLPSTDPIRDARALLAGGDWHTADSVLADSAATQNLADRRASALLRAQCAASWSTALPAAAKSNHPEHILDKIRRAQEANGQAANGAGTRSDSILAVGAGSGANPLLKDQDQTQSEEFEPEEKPKAGAVPGWLIDSQNTPELQYWDIIMLCAIAYVAVMTPYEVAFLEPEYNAMFVINRFLDCVFLGDMTLQFFITARDAKGNWIKDAGTLRCMYLKGWFWIDCISILPFDILGLMVSSLSEFKVIRAIRVLRLFKLLRLIRTSRIMQRWENHYSINYALVGLVNYMVFTLLATHWFACLYHLVAYIQGIGTNTWIDQQDTEVDGNGQVYVMCVNWAAQTISSIGYGDALATTTTERIMVIFMMMMGSTIFAFALAEISYAVQQMGVKEEHYHSIIDSVNTYTSEITLPTPLATRCREYVKHKHSTNTLQAVDDTLAKLSRSLREEVAMHTHSGWVQSVDFFKGCPSGFVVTVASLMNVCTYTATETIYNAGEVVTNMYVVNKGMVAKSGQILSAGKLLGMEMTYMMLYRPVKYVETAKALSYADLFSLSWTNFRNSLEEYPRVFPQVKKIAVKAIFQKHILAFSAACRNYASDNLGRTRDHVVKMMEDELLAKKEKRLLELKGLKQKEEAASGVMMRQSVTQQLAEISSTITNLDRQMTAKETGGVVTQGLLDGL